MLDFNGLQVLQNIANNQEPFQCNELLLSEVTDGIQHGIQPFSTSSRIQVEYLPAMQFVMDRFHRHLRVRPSPWTLLNRVTPIMFSEGPVPDADQTAFLAAYALPPTAGPRPPSDPPSDVPRETALAAAARTTPRDDSQQCPTPPRRPALGYCAGVFYLSGPRSSHSLPPLHLVHPAASATTNPAARPAPRTFTSLKNKCVNTSPSLLVSRIKLPVARPRRTLPKATPSEPFTNESKPREYVLHARTRPSSGSSTVWLDDDFRDSNSAGPPPLTFRKDDSDDDSDDYDAQGRGIAYHRH